MAHTHRASLPSRFVAIEKARVRARDRDLQDALHEASDRARPKLRLAVVQAATEARAETSTAAVVRALREAAPEKVIEALHIDAVVPEVSEVTELLREVYVAGGKVMSETLAAGYAGRAIEVRLDTLNPAVVAFLQAHRLDLVTRMSETGREAVRIVLETGLQNGRYVKDIADELRDIVGLNARQAQALVNFRRALENGDLATATARKLGGELDAEVRDALGRGKLPKARIKVLVAAYRNRLLERRAEDVARSETIRALSAGQHATMKQAVRDGAVNGNALRRYWLVTPDEITCPVCTGIVLANPNGVGMDEPFVSSLGSIMHAPAHTNCRCSEFYRLETENKFLAELNPAPRMAGQRFETLAEAYARKPVGGPLRRRKRRAAV